MKKIGFCIGIAVSFFLFACSGKTDYEKALPEDAALVASFDLNSIAVKGGLEGGQGQLTMQRLCNILKSSISGSDGLIDKIGEDPEESGLSFQNKLYVFVGARSSLVGMLMRTVNDRKVEDLLELLREQGVCDGLHESDGCKWTVMGKVLVAYTEDAFLVLASPDGRNARDMQHTAAMLLRQEIEDSYAASDDFQCIQRAKGDITVWASMALLPERYTYPLTMGLSAELKGENVKALAVLNFEQGKLCCDIRSLTTDEVMSGVVDKYADATAPVAGRYLDVFPLNTFGWATAHVNGELLFKYLNENPTVHQYFEHSIMPLDFHAIFSAIRGDVSLAVTDPLNGYFIAYADVNNTEFLQTFENLKPLIAMTGGQMMLTNKGKHAYEFYAMDASLLDFRPGPARVWFGVKNNKLYFTNKESLPDQKVLGLSLRNAEWGSSVPGKRVFVSLDFKSLMPSLEPSLRNKITSPLLFAGIDRLDHLIVAGGEDQNLHLELVFKDRAKNALEQIVTLLTFSE